MLGKLSGIHIDPPMPYEMDRGGPAVSQTPEYVIGIDPSCDDPGFVPHNGCFGPAFFRALVGDRRSLRIAEPATEAAKGGRPSSTVCVGLGALRVLAKRRTIGRSTSARSCGR